MSDNLNSSLNQRETFSGKFGFILSCIGSAVGMGNIWLFPYRVGQYGGAAFLIPYFIFVFVIGFTGVIGEMAFGRAMESGPLGAFKKAAQMRNKNWGEILGAIPVIGSLGIAIGYSVVVGWIIRFTVGSFTSSAMNVDSEIYFGQIAGNFGSIGWHILGLAVVFLLMIFGVSKGIERVNKFMMPAFFILFIILAVRVSLLDNVSDGYAYLFKPNWKLLAEPKTWVFALGQAFFSLSLAGSGTVVYGSYLKKSVDIVSCAKNVAVFDTLAAIVAAIVIIPAVFSFGLNPAAGPPLMFITMPKVFQLMPMGQIFAIVFFIAVLFAAITSLMNLFETSVESIQSKFKLSRVISVSIVAIIAVLVGILIESGEAVSKWMDIVSIYIIPLGALLSGFMFFWVCGDDFVKQQVEMGRDRHLGRWFKPATKYLFVGLTVVVYILSIFYGGIG